MLISAVAWRALVDAEVVVVPLDAERVELRSGTDHGVFTVVASPVPLTPSDIVELKSRHQEPTLLIVPSATPAAQAAAETAGWSWLVDNGREVTGVLRLAGHRIELGGQGDAGAPPRRPRPGRVPWGTFTLVRRLFERPYASQQELATLVGISQPRVSQALATLTEQRLVRRTPAGWSVRGADEVMRWWLESYPGPGGIRTLWYGLESPVEQARTVIGLLNGGTGEPPAAVTSGDVAADFIAPWRTPHRAVIYARTGVDLTTAGLTPAGEAEATLEFIVPKDPGVWPPTMSAEEQQASLPLADPLQVLWDVRRTSGADTDEAVQRLREVLRSKRADGGHAA